MGLSLRSSAFLQHELRAGQRALGGVDQQQDAIDHGQGALDLAAEVGVPGRVDDVDLGALVEDGGVLGQDGDAALALELVGVHDAVDDGLVLAKGAGLAQHLVDQRGLAVVDVGDDGDVADVGGVEGYGSPLFSKLPGPGCGPGSCVCSFSCFDGKSIHIIHAGVSGAD